MLNEKFKYFSLLNLLANAIKKNHHNKKKTFKTFVKIFPTDSSDNSIIYKYLVLMAYFLRKNNYSKLYIHFIKSRIWYFLKLIKVYIPQQEHLVACPYREVACPHEGCQQNSIIFTELKHHQVACGYRLINCENCGQQMMAMEKSVSTFSIEASGDYYCRWMFDIFLVFGYKFVIFYIV